jgi:hypothetical protein
MTLIEKIRHFLDVSSIAVWENEGGTPGRNFDQDQYGRRVEMDRSWTIYHVFSGLPAFVGGQVMTGLSRSAATAGMLALNLGNAVVRPDGRSLSIQAAHASTTGKG